MCIASPGEATKGGNRKRTSVHYKEHDLLAPGLNLWKKKKKKKRKVGIRRKREEKRKILKKESDEHISSLPSNVNLRGRF